MIGSLLSYLPLLLLTLLLEGAVVALLMPGSQRRDALRVCIALNLFTHPTSTLLSWRWNVDLIPLESFVFFCEWLGYGQILKLRWPRSLSLALLANLVSWAAGIGVWWWRMTH